MAEIRTEKRVALDGIASVSVFNPIGRIDVEGWDEPDLLITSKVVADTDAISPEQMEPVIRTEKDQLQIRSMDLSGIKKDLKEATADFEMNFENIDGIEGLDAIPDVVGKIVAFATSSAQKVRPGFHTSLHIRLPVNIDLSVQNLNGVISVKNMDSRLHIKAVNGPVGIQNVKGQVQAKSVNGPVSLDKSTPEKTVLKSVNGPVKCYLDSVTGAVQLKSVNGPVRLTVPDNADVNLTAKTMHGAVKISSAFQQSLRTPKKVCGTLQNGRFPITIKTFTGPLTVVTTETEDAPAAPPPKPVVTPPTQSPVSHASDPAGKPAETPDPAAEMIERMLADGKISEAEADKLKRAL